MTISTLIKQLDQLKEQLDSFRPIPPDYYRKIMQKLHLDWNYNSNSIEGNTLTLSETKQLLYYGLTAKGKPINDHKEMEGHAKVLKRMEEIVHQDLLLTETLIKEFHSLILVPDYDKSKEQEVEINPGQWKQQPNYLLTPTGEKLEFLPPEEVPAAMNELINWANNQLHQNNLNRHNKKKYNLHPLKIACGFHKRFIDIHPFGDGNGRMARILMNLILMQQGYMPAIVYLEERQEYYRALNTSTFEDISPLADYIGKNLMKSMQLAIEGAQGKPVEEQKDWMKELSVLGRKLKDRKKLSKLTDWSIDNQEIIIEQVFIPFIEGIYEESMNLKEVYDQVKWSIIPSEYDTRGKFYELSPKTINTVEEIRKELLDWHNGIKTDKAFYARDKELNMMLLSKDNLIESMAISIKLFLEKENYIVKCSIVNYKSIVFERKYNEITDSQTIKEHIHEIMTTIIHAIKE